MIPFAAYTAADTPIAFRWAGQRPKFPIFCGYLAPGSELGGGQLGAPAPSLSLKLGPGSLTYALNIALLTL